MWRDKVKEVINILENSNVNEIEVTFWGRRIRVVKNASNLFSNSISTGSIKKGNKASFNLFDFTLNQLLNDKSCNPKLSVLDKESLTHVWSAGEQYKV